MTASPYNPADNQAFATYYSGASFTPTYYEQGVNLTTWPISAGPASEFFEYMADEGTTPIILNEGIGGYEATQILSTELPSMRTSLAAVSKTGSDVDLVVVIHGEQDRLDATKASFYEMRLEQIVQICESECPNALVAIALLAAEDSDYVKIRNAQTAVANRRANRYLIDCSDFESGNHLVGGYHHYKYSGMQLLAERLWDALPSYP